jgi:transposase
MSKRKYRTYTKEFKLEALKLLKESGKSAGQIERDLGITPGLLVKWKAPAKREIRRLKRELSEVEEEREILKKALNIFSRTDKPGTGS